MNLAELLANESVRREEFPVARDKVFLAHAGVCPLPRRVIDAISRYTSEASRGDQEHFVYPGVLDEARREAAQLLRARADEIALVGPTSLALSFVASGMKWRRS